jgi:hypothetical protein
MANEAERNMTLGEYDEFRPMIRSYLRSVKKLRKT